MFLINDTLGKMQFKSGQTITKDKMNRLKIDIILLNNGFYKYISYNMYKVLK